MILISEAMDAKKYDFNLLLAVKYVKVTRLRRNSYLMCRATCRMYIPSLKLKPKYVERNSEKNSTGARLISPLPSVFGHQMAKNCPTITKIGKGQDTNHRCYQIWGLYIMFEAMISKKWILPVILVVKQIKCPDCDETRTRCVAPHIGCIYQVLNWYLEAYKKARTTLKNPKSAKKKNNSPNSENKIFVKNGTDVDWYIEGYLCITFKGFGLIDEAVNWKKEKKK